MTEHRKIVQGKTSSYGNEGIQRIYNNIEQGTKEYRFKGHNKMKQNKGKRIQKGQGINIRFRAMVLKVRSLDKQLQLHLRIWEAVQILMPPETYQTQKIWEWNPAVCLKACCLGRWKRKYNMNTAKMSNKEHQPIHHKYLQIKAKKT